MPEITDEGEPLVSAEWERDIPGPIWSWWLAAAKPDGAGLRRWQLWVWWARQRGAQKRLSAAVRFLRGFIEAPLEAWGGVRRFGQKTKNVHGVSCSTQFRQLLLLRWRFGVRPDSYYKFQLFNPSGFLQQRISSKRSASCYRSSVVIPLGRQMSGCL